MRNCCKSLTGMYQRNVKQQLAVKGYGFWVMSYGFRVACYGLLVKLFNYGLWFIKNFFILLYITQLKLPHRYKVQECDANKVPHSFPAGTISF